MQSNEFEQLLSFQNDLNPGIKNFPQLVQRVDDIFNKKVNNQNLNSFEKKLLNLYSTIHELNDFVGQYKLKEQLCRFILHCIESGPQDHRMKNMCIFGPPGNGKSMLCSILARIFYFSGLLGYTEANSKIPYIEGKRANLIASYMGQTAPKTQEIIDQCIREKKCLIIDEIYSIGGGGGSSSSSRADFDAECINTICGNLTANPTTFRLIIAGYKEETLTYFFNQNKGLHRRFRFYELATYSHGELRDIFLQQLLYAGWDIEQPFSTAKSSWFKKHHDKFYFSGGDIESLVGFATEYATQRTLERPALFKGKLNQEDLELALKELLESRKKNEQEKQFREEIIACMYS